MVNFRLASTGNAIPAGRLSIMGSSDHTYVKSTINSDQTTTERIHLGDGQYIDEVMGGGPAKGGTTVPIRWSPEEAFAYLLHAADELSIPYFRVLAFSRSDDVVYFQSKFEYAFATCARYIDSTLDRYESQRSLMSRIFGPVCITDWDSVEGKDILREVKRILLNYKNASV